MRQALKETGAEPDESWCLGEEKEFPDLVLEIALTSGGVSKLEIYHRFPVPEVWIWRGNKLEVFVRHDDGSGYDQVTRSRLLPGLGHRPAGALRRDSFLAGIRRAFRAGLREGKPSA